MRSCGLVLIAACSPGPRDVAAPDATPVDAVATGCVMTGLTPVSITGSSPAGLIDRYHFAYATAGFSDCADEIDVHFVVDDQGTCLPQLDLGVGSPFMSPGSQAAWAYLSGSESAGAPSVTFDATRLVGAENGQSSPYIAGRFHASAAGWAFDIDVDMPAQPQAGCSI